MAADTIDNRTVTSKGARAAIMQCFKAQRPVFLWGPPGIGKSEVVEGICNDLGGFMIDLRLGQMDPTDIRGIPFFNKDLGKMDWAPPIELPDEELASQYPVVVLFLDEMNSAAPAVQAAGYQLILNRRVGKYVLPDNVVIVAAGNRESDRGVTYRMPTPLANRFVHIEMRCDYDSWLDWAVMNDIEPDVVGYISFAKQDLYNFDPKSSSRAFATPRSWTFVSQLLSDCDDYETTTNLIAGTVGEGMAVKFMAHRKVASAMPKPADILSGKVTELKTKEIGAMYSLVISMCYELKEYVTNNNGRGDEKFDNMTNNFIKFMLDNFETELVVMGVRVALVSYKLPISKSEQLSEFAKKYGKYVLAAHQS